MSRWNEKAKISRRTLLDRFVQLFHKLFLR